MGKNTDEPQELINFCLDKCTQDDCDGTDGCYAYQVERAKLLGLPAPEKPNRGPYKRKEAPLILTSFKEQEVVVAHAKTPVTATHTTKEQQELGLITAAIEALDAALEVIPNDHWVSAFIDAPEQLRRYRSEAYGHMVDWKAIAGGGLTPPTRGGV